MEQKSVQLLEEILHELKRINEYIDFKKHKELQKVAAFRELPMPDLGFKGVVNGIKSTEQMKHKRLKDSHHRV